MVRVKFSERNMQREFLKKVILACGAPSLRELSKRFDVNYSTFKNYYNEDRLIPKELYNDLTRISRIKFKVKEVDDFWGQVKGGKK
ncbi:MAG TPA: hypothetical protein VJH92_01245 [Candidatus Nanoarchaeia archaeon]|nr:hypothetical protein [Candidatus Nanoarchaeia archaeon]